MTPLEIKVFLHHSTGTNDPYPVPSDAASDATRALAKAGLLRYADHLGCMYETPAGERLRLKLCSIPMRDPGDDETVTITMPDAMVNEVRKLADKMNAEAAFDLREQQEHFLEPEEPESRAVSISVGVGHHPDGGLSVSLIMDNGVGVGIPPNQARILSKQLATTADGIDSEREREMAWNRRYKDYPDVA
jgi:hypothetical protein